MKVYNFLTKANAIKEAASNLAYGLQLDLKHDLNSTIYKYLEEAGSYSNRWDLYYSRDLLYAVDNQITNKLDDIKDWPEACMVNLDEKAQTLLTEKKQLHSESEITSRGIQVPS